MPHGELPIVSVLLVTFWLLETVYVPVPPVPVPKAVIVVPELTPLPETVEPISSPPELTAATFSTVPAAVPAALAMVPVTEADDGSSVNVVLVPFWAIASSPE